MSMIKFDNCAWVDLQRSKAISHRSQVTVGLIKKKVSGSGVHARAYGVLWLRKEASEWFDSNGPRFRIQIGGDCSNFLRLIPDQSGLFTGFVFKGVKKVPLGIVTAWPNEARNGVDAEYRILKESFVVILPEDFAQPKEKSRLRDPVHAKAPADAVLHELHHKRGTAVGLVATTKSADIGDDDKIPKPTWGNTNSSDRLIGGVKISSEEISILEVLLKRDHVTHDDMLMIATNHISRNDENNRKYIGPSIFMLNQKLSQINISIESIFGGGYRLDARSKARLLMFIERAGGSVT